MVLREVPVPSITGGLTQLPTPIARPDRMTLQKNYLPFAERGLTKRFSLKRVASIVDNPFQAPMLQRLDLGEDDTDRFVLHFSNESVKVWTPGGEEVPVFAVTRDA